MSKNVLMELSWEHVPTFQKEDIVNRIYHCLGTARYVNVRLDLFVMKIPDDRGTKEHVAD